MVDIELRVLAGELLDADGKINGTDVPFSVLKDGVNNARPGHHPASSRTSPTRGPATASPRSADDLTCAGVPSARWS